jgi:toxin-antitoxin system PIN domain toxin
MLIPMKCPDVNLLVYAHRRDQEHHGFYREWVEGMAVGREPFGLTSLVALAFVRIVTQPRFPGGPTPYPLALAEIDNLLQAPNCRWITAGPRHWDLVSTLIRATGATGKQVADAQHAAVAMENGCVWVTRDTDFERFRSQGLRCEILAPG